MNERDLAYAAGLIDGEGCFGLAEEKTSQRPSHRPYIAVTMTVEAPVRWLHDLFGVGSIRHTPAKPPRREKWTWRANGAGARQVADLLLPHLMVKGLPAYLVICFYEEGLHVAGHGRRVPDEEIDRRRALKEEFHLANARGVA